MIILLTGDNVYEINEALAQIVAAHSAEPEYYDVDTMQPRDLVDIFEGLSLFAAKRLVVLKKVSENADVWEKLTDYADKESDTTVVLVEPKVDKRTKVYKVLAKAADTRAFTAWGERDTGKAEQWLKKQADARHIALDGAAAREIVRRRGVEQYQLLNTLTQLAQLGAITKETVESHIEPPLEENVFSLLETALSGTPDDVRRKLRVLTLTNDPYMTMGLLSSQVIALAGLVYGAGRSQSEIVSELGLSAFVLRNFTQTARSLSATKMAYAIDQLAAADYGLKSKTVDQWVQIEVALAKIATYR